MTNIDTSKTTWDLSPLLAGDDDPKIQQYRDETTKLVDAFVAKWRDRDDYLKDPKLLKQALDEMEALERRPGIGNEMFYFGLRASQDAIDSKLKAKEKQADDFMREVVNKLQFFNLAVGKIDPKTQVTMLANADLVGYRHYLERIFSSAKYRLSEAEEKILVLKQEPAHGSWTSMVSAFLAKAEREVEKEDGSKGLATEEEIRNLFRSQNKRVRDGAAAAFNNILDQYVEVAESEFNAILANKKIDDELRGYERPDISRHVSDDIDTEVIDALVDAISDRNDIPRRYYELRAKLLGLPKLAYHERQLSYGDMKSAYSYAEASQLVYDTFEGLDHQFADIFGRFLEDGQIDALPRKGKRGGAFCATNSLAQPVYVMLNHTDNIRDVATIAHEMGHAINSELMRDHENGLTFTTPMATAEVASTFMEDFVLERLRKEANEEEELALLINQLDDTVATTFRQIALYRFEQELHAEYRKQGYLSKEEIGKLFQKHMSAYMGPGVEQSPGSENWWVSWPHIRYFFYVYSYASGLLISKAMQAKVRADKSFIKQVKVFLSTGISKSPKDIFTELGIDITDKAFWQQGLDEIDQLLKDTEALAKKLGKI